jgi:hypothetical protein
MKEKERMANDGIGSVHISGWICFLCKSSKRTVIPDKEKITKKYSGNLFRRIKMNNHVHSTLRSALSGTIKEMIADFEDKDLFATIETPESNICDYCEGKCEVIATERINSATIDVPYKTCPECGGSGIKEY